jgi:predicted deacylase
MQVGGIEGQIGKRVNGRLVAGYTTSRIPVELPITIVMGVKPGKTLVVSGGVHGREILGPLGVGKVLREADPQQMSGNLVAVPLANMSSFEFGDRNSLWDTANLEDEGTGRADGSTTQRLAYRLWNDVVSKGDAYIEIHSAGGSSHVWYTIFFGDVDGARAETTARSKEMALAFGLEEVWATTPWPAPLKDEAMRQGIPCIMPEVGGGSDWLENGDNQIAACARGITNVMKLMNILPGEIETESDKAVIWDGRDEFYNDDVGGLLLKQCKRGDHLTEGDLFGIKYDPTTGEEIGRVFVPLSGTLLATGVLWPLCPPGHHMGVLGHKIEEIDLTKRGWSF